MHDTCGVHNLHGMPAVISAIASVIYAAFVTREQYKSDFGTIFPAMLNETEIAANNNSTEVDATTHILGVSIEWNRKSWKKEREKE